jgi:hypothetical protein
VEKKRSSQLESQTSFLQAYLHLLFLLHNTNPQTGRIPTFEGFYTKYMHTHFEERIGKAKRGKHSQACYAGIWQKKEKATQLFFLFFFFFPIIYSPIRLILSEKISIKIYIIIFFFSQCFAGSFFQQFGCTSEVCTLCIPYLLDISWRAYVA